MQVTETPTTKMVVSVFVIMFVVFIGSIFVVKDLKDAVQTNRTHIDELNKLQNTVLATQDRNREVDLQNTAIDCMILRTVGAELPDGCFSELVLKHYDPDQIKPTTAGQEQIDFFREHLCLLLERTGEPSEDCLNNR